MKRLLCSLLLPFSIYAQLPETDIWLFKIDKKENKYVFSNPLNITHRVGYDNQPTFSLDGKSILYVCIDSSNQADIYKYEIKSKLHTNITKSKISEYSPTILPNGSGFTTVVVESDSAQRLWQYNLDGSFNKISHQNTDSIGYHTWLNNDTLLYYKLTKPHSLRVLNLKTDKDVWICDEPTRAFKKVGSTAQFIYGVKKETVIEYRLYDPTLRESRVYATHQSLNEDYIWHHELGLIKSENADLIRYDPITKTWDILFSFTSLGIKKITRFVFDAKNKQLAIVSNL